MINAITDDMISAKSCGAYRDGMRISSDLPEQQIIHQCLLHMQTILAAATAVRFNLLHK